MNTFIIISLISIILILFLNKYVNIIKIKSIDNSNASLKQKQTNYFTLCSEDSIKLALANIDYLVQNNERDKRLYKSFLSLECSKEDLKMSFYFLKDCAYFCKNEPIYNNKDFLSSLSTLEVMVLNYYINVDSNKIPFDRLENHRFGKEFELDKNLTDKQLEELKLIEWRSKEIWRFWAEKYGIDNKLGQHCLEMAS
jgi:hypothetical protein